MTARIYGRDEKTSAGGSIWRTICTSVWEKDKKYVMTQIITDMILEQGKTDILLFCFGIRM